MKKYIKNHHLIGRKLLNLESKVEFDIVKVFNVDFCGNSYNGLDAIFESSEDYPIIRITVDWEMLEVDEESDIGLHWQEHIQEMHKSFKLV